MTHKEISKMKKTDKPEGFITLSEEQLEAVSGGLEEAAAQGTENKAQEQQYQMEQQNPQLITLEQMLEKLGGEMHKPTSEEMMENLKQTLQQNGEQQQAAPATPGVDAQTQQAQTQQAQTN